MWRLRTFGGLSIESDDGIAAGVAARRRSLALLALLAIAGDRGLSRDKIVALLWPESDEEHGRNSLSQCLAAVRREMSAEDPVIGAVELRLNPSVITSDVGEFERHVASGALDRAASLYRGPFLDGFYLRETAAFERWADEQRRRLHELCAATLERLARAAEERSDHALAVAWWRQLAALDPTGAHATLGLMRALGRVGDRVGAIRHYRTYEELLRQELDVAPEASVAALAKALAAVRTDLVAAAHWSDPGLRPKSLGVRAVAPPKPAVANRARRLRPRVVLVLIVAVVAALPAAFLTWHSRSYDELKRSRRPELVAILPFDVDSPDSTVGFLRDGMPDLIAAALAGLPGLQVVDQHAVLSVLHESAINSGEARGRADGVARRLGAAHVLTGVVIGTWQRLTINARMIDSGHAASSPAAEATGPLDSLSTLVDQLATTLLAGTMSADKPHFTDLSKRSLQVLRAYVNGRVAYRQGRLNDATNSFSEALRADSSFGLAALAMAASGAWNTTSLFLRDEKDFQVGWSLRNQLPNVDRMLFDAYVVSKNPSDETDAAELDAWERVYRLAPERPDVAYGYGDRLFHVGAYLEIPDAERQAANAFAYAVSLDSGLYMPLGHLAEIAAREGQRERALHLLRMYESGGAEADADGFLRWEVAATTGDSTSLRALRNQIPGMSAASLRRIASFAQIDGLDIGDAVLAVSSLLNRQATPTERGSDLYRAHALALNRGRTAESRSYLRELQSLRGSDPFLSVLIGNADELRVLDALFSLGDSADAEAAAGALSEGSALGWAPGVLPSTAPADLCTAELWRLAHGIGSHTRSSLERLRASGAESDSARYYGWNPALCIAMIEALRDVLTSMPNADVSVARLDSIMMRGPHQFGSAFGNLLLARLQESRGQYAKALAAVRRRRRDVDDGPLYAADALAMETQLLRALGDTVDCRRTRSRYSALRGDDIMREPVWSGLRQAQDERTRRAEGLAR